MLTPSVRQPFLVCMWGVAINCGPTIMHSFCKNRQFCKILYHWNFPAIQYLILWYLLSCWFLFIILFANFHWPTCDSLHTWAWVLGNMTCDLWVFSHRTRGWTNSYSTGMCVSEDGLSQVSHGGIQSSAWRVVQRWGRRLDAFPFHLAVHVVEDWELDCMSG